MTAAVSRQSGLSSGLVSITTTLGEPDDGEPSATRDAASVVAWLGPAGHGTLAKLVLNNQLADLTEATAETLSFARRLDLDPAKIVDLLQLTPLGAPYAVQKARSMLAGDFSPAFALKHWRDTAASGHADDDLSAVYLFS